jgi:hypothetical protein
MEVRTQLELTKEQLERIGFKENYSPADRIDGAPVTARTWHSIPVVNAEFIYNVDYAPYKWYFRSEVGDGYNWNWLDIGKAPELFVLLMCFQAKYNLIMDL